MHYQRQQRFSSFDEFNGFPHGWDVDFSTTTPEAYTATLSHSIAPGVMINTAWLSSPTLQQGTSPAGMRTFAIPLHLQSPYSWRGLPVDDRTLIYFPSDAELFSLMGAESEILTLSADQSLVDANLLSWELDAEAVFAAPRISKLSAGEYAAVARNLSLVLEFIGKYGSHETFPELSSGILEYLLENMLQPVVGVIEHSRVSESFAAKRVKVASDYILQHLHEPLTVTEVCVAIGSNRRSLEQCFQKYAGTSPKQFILQIRFKHCRNALAAAAPDGKVSDIAGKHGFWHMGQFSATYQRLFGEKPSTTLARYPTQQPRSVAH